MRDKRSTNASLVDRKGETRVALALFNPNSEVAESFSSFVVVLDGYVNAFVGEPVDSSGASETAPSNSREVITERNAAVAMS